MATYTFPSAAELREIEREKLPRLTADRPAFDLMPMQDLDAPTLLWEQQDVIRGVQQVRGVNADPLRVKPIGAKQYIVTPGYYGEFRRIDELELTTRRRWGTFNQPVSIDDLVMDAQDQLLERRLDRIELTLWTLLVTGTFTALGPVGQVLHTDIFPVQSFTAGVTWATYATATPLANLRAIQLLARGTSAAFDRRATVYMNQGTFNDLIANTNAADLYGRRTAGLGIVNNITQLNDLLMGENLPSITIYDEGYFDESGNFQLFIPNNKAVLVGRRTSGTPIGFYALARNANNMDLGPGAYTRVIDRGELTVPRSIEVHDGHNGGPVILFPKAVVRMTV